RTATAPTCRRAKNEHARVKDPGGVAEDRPPDVGRTSELDVSRPERSREDAEREQGEAGEEKAVFGKVESVERRESAENASEVLLFQMPLLNQVKGGGREGEREEPISEEVHRYVQRQDRALDARRGLRRRRRDNPRPQKERE